MMHNSVQNLINIKKLIENSLNNLKVDKKPKIIDLFSGCGGLNEGFKQAGFLTSVSNDIWGPAGKTFEKNNKDGEFILGDITQKKIRDKIIKEFVK